jgi:hypothetical protein
LGLLSVLAFLAQAKLSESFPGVYAVVVTVAKHKLHSVTTNVFGAYYSEIIGDGSWIKYAKAGNFADAVSAHAFGPQMLDRIHAHVPVVPFDGDLGCASFLYLKRSGHRK